MDSLFWAKVHGGTTHFPIALLIASALFDLAGYALNRESHSRDLHAASFYALILGAVASFAAVLSGLIITHWETLGGGLLGKHHLASRRTFGIYLGVLLVTAVLMTVAGYWGGEMMLGGASS
jgi:uncharacterized membrane protein